ncbi:MAG: hypothetical protein JNL87_16655, partial [Burkholderiaceae bacterium]|nr:hypothetical protein [Burkholderiaceae bacterium]
MTAIPPRPAGPSPARPNAAGVCRPLRPAMSWALAAATLAATPAQALVQIWDGCCGNHLLSDPSPSAVIFQEMDDSRLSGLSGNYRASAGADLAAGTVSGFIEAFRSDRNVSGPLEVHTWSQTGDSITFEGPAPVEIHFSYHVTGRFELLDLGGLYARNTFYAGSSRYFNIVWG